VAELAGSACFWPALPVLAGGGVSTGFSRHFLLTGVPWGGGRVGLLLSHHHTLPPW